MFEGFRIVKYDDMLTARTLQILGCLSLSSVLSFLAVAVLNIVPLITQFTDKSKCHLGYQR